MTGLRWIQMSADEMDEFLERGGTGVLSFSPNVTGPPPSLPVSYGYNADSGGFYFQLSFSPNGRKRDVVDGPVTFVVHRNTEAGWRSVVATGELEDLTDGPYESAALQEMWAVDIPFVDIFDKPKEEIEFRHFRLVLDRMTGRKEVED